MIELIAFLLKFQLQRYNKSATICNWYKQSLEDISILDELNIQIFRQIIWMMTIEVWE